MGIQLIADSGSTKCEWCLLEGEHKKTVFTPGMSPYFLSSEQMLGLLQTELMPHLHNKTVEAVYFYGTGLANITHAKAMRKLLQQLFPHASIQVEHDLLAAARATCGVQKGVACILGTGSNSCYFNGKKIVKNNPGLGFILGDEGSGAYLGKKVLQYYLYNTFDKDLRARFDAKFVTTPKEILENVYMKPLPNRYLASFALFLSENRGHYMIENILEDGLNDFFFTHLCKYNESWTMPIHFVGGIAYGFRDVLQLLCANYEFELGKIFRNPMEGLVQYHKNAASLKVS